MDSALSRGMVSFHPSTLPPYVAFRLELHMVLGGRKQLQAHHPSTIGIHYVKFQWKPPCVLLTGLGSPAEPVVDVGQCTRLMVAPGSQAHPCPTFKDGTMVIFTGTAQYRSRAHRKGNWGMVNRKQSKWKLCKKIKCPLMENSKSAGNWVITRMRPWKCVL